MKPKRTSLEDIAKKVGVSKATVSFVLNDKGDEFNISKSKQELIRAAAKELSYVPNFFAKSLRQGETKTIGLVVSDIANAFYAELCKVIQIELNAKGYSVFIVNTNEEKEREKTLMKELIQRSIDGMIISPINKIEALIPILHSTHIPVVFTDRQGDENADFVGVDNFSEAFNLVSAFSKKPKKLAIVAQSNVSAISIENRALGAKKACEEKGIEFVLVHLSTIQENNAVTIQKLKDEGVDSYLALDNVVGLRTLGALRNSGIEIPKQARLISFEDREAFQYIDPPITALQQPIQSMAKLSVDRICDRINEVQTPGKHTILTSVLAERGSH